MLISEDLLPYSLGDATRRDALGRILSHALEAVDPAQAVARYLHVESNTLHIADRAYDLQDIARLWLISIGKAGVPMATAVARILGDRLNAGIVLTKQGYAQHAQGLHTHTEITLLEAGHPIPDARGVAATQRIAQFLQATTENDLVLCLISGGGSALLAAPADGVSLADLQTLTGLLLACGASIDEINTLRKHLELAKGGNLARLAAPAHMAALVLSDVIGSSLDIIASGPTAPDPSTFSDARAILERYRLTAQVPAAILDHLQRGCRGEVAETPKPGDPLFTRVQNEIVGSNLQACQAGLAQARSEGFNTLLLTTSLQGEAGEVGRLLASILRQVCTDGQPLSRPACLVAGGETTVHLHGKGIGGRNQELALGAVNDLAGLNNVALIALATDGDDGPTDSAGACVTGDTFARARALGLSTDHYMSDNDAYRYFDALGDLLKTGPTQTNVNDITFLFAF